MPYRYEKLVTIHLPMDADTITKILAALDGHGSLVIMKPTYPDQRDGGPYPDEDDLVIAKKTPR